MYSIRQNYYLDFKCFQSLIELNQKIIKIKNVAKDTKLF